VIVPAVTAASGGGGGKGSSSWVSRSRKGLLVTCELQKMEGAAAGMIA
jgi:hypothetical protein